MAQLAIIYLETKFIFQITLYIKLQVQFVFFQKILFIYTLFILHTEIHIHQPDFYILFQSFIHHYVLRTLIKIFKRKKIIAHHSKNQCA